jgi:hypothetical protein
MMKIFYIAPFLLLLLTNASGLPSLTKADHGSLHHSQTVRGKRMIEPSGCNDSHVNYVLKPRRLSIKSMDICLLISGMKHMSSRWIQPLGVSLDAQLKERGIGMEKRNRFCFIQFGARGIDIRAKFVDQFEGFYGSDQLGLIRKALKSNGFVADGYQAIQFALDNVPFRTDPDVGKSIILVTNAGRTSLATSSNLTLIPMRDMLLKSNFSIDVIVNMTLPQTAIGFNSSHLMGYSSADSSSYTTSSISTLPVSQSHSNTLSSYVGLSLESNGGVWTLDAIKDTNASLISALSVAMVNGWSILDDTSCHACSCNNICTTPILQSSCKSCVNSTSKKCLQSMTDKVSQGNHITFYNVIL